jgi:hypothetical protein
VPEPFLYFVCKHLRLISVFFMQFIFRRRHEFLSFRAAFDVCCIP